MESVKKLFEALKKDAALAEKLKVADKAYEGRELTEPERLSLIEREIMPIIREAGYKVTLKELEDYGESLKPKTGELSDDELEAVAGGKKIAPMPCVGSGEPREIPGPPEPIPPSCFCCGHGIGECNGNQIGCSCWLAGQGGGVCFCTATGTGYMR